MRFLTYSTAVLLAGFLTTAAALGAEQRFALVIGNSNYKDAPLKNPANDANLIEKTLSDLGFQVTKKLDLDQRGMERAVTQFGHGLPSDSVACLYYAGHGLQVDGNNYLVPIDAEINAKWDVKYETLDQHRLIDMLKGSRSRVRMVVLDCCLNNPFDRSWRKTRAYQESRMAPAPKAPSGTIILYATGEGQTAADGVGENSPFTQAVATAFSARPEGGLLLTEAIARVGHTMEQQFGKEQKPFMTVDTAALTFRLYGDQTPVSLSPKPTAQPTPTPKTFVEAEVEAKLPGLSALNDKPLNDPEDFDDSLLSQAREFHNAGKYDVAIEAYNAVLEQSTLEDETRRKARLWRGQCYKRRGKASDLSLALIDYRAAGKLGLPMTVQTDKADVRNGTTVRGRVRKHQSAVVSHIRDENGMTWYHVVSVDQDDSLKGWVTSKAFGLPTSKSTTTSGPSTTASSTSRPTTRYQSSTNGQYTQNGRSSNSYYNNQSSNSTRNYQPNSSSRSQNNSGYSGLDSFSRQYKQRNGRPPSIWETPQWESPSDIRRLRAQGLIR